MLATLKTENETTEQTADVIDKLVERCGGYVVVTTNNAGRRVIN